MTLSLNSPRFSLRTARFEDVDAALADTGHAVLDDAWNLDFLRNMHDVVTRKYADEDRRYAGRLHEMSREEALPYLGGAIYFQNLFDLSTREGQIADTLLERSFFSEVDRSGLPGLLRHLFSHGDFMIGRTEFVLRRYEPRTMPLCFVMLHDDYQFGVCARAGLASHRAVTIWTPLQACTDDKISRLLLLHRGEGYKDLFTEKERIAAHECYGLDRDPSKVDPFFQRIFDRRRCYAPYVPFGSSIVFDHQVIHGTFRLPGMDRPRYSMDFRAVGEYRTTPDNAFITGRIYRNATYQGTA